MHDEKLFEDPPPPEDCPICFLPLPGTNKYCFRPCCGKIICDGCDCAVVAKDYERGKKEEEIGLCPFCRTPAAHLPEEIVEKVKKLMEKGDANSFYVFAQYYERGTMGMPQDYTKANELFLKAGELGDAAAYGNLGNSYHNGSGVDVDKKKSKHFYERAAMGGDAEARYNLGYMEGQAGNMDRCLKHLIIAAKFGHRASLDKIMDMFAARLATKDDYEQSLRAYHERQLEIKSEARDKAAANRARTAASRLGQAL